MARNGVLIGAYLPQELADEFKLRAKQGVITTSDLLKRLISAYLSGKPINEVSSKRFERKSKTK